MVHRITIVSACALLGIIVAASSPAAGQASDDELARSHFQAGSAYFEQARYEDAAREFLEAYRLSPRPELLINASAARERALDFDGAIELLERYLAEAPAADNRRTIETRIERIRELRARTSDPSGADTAADPPPADSPPAEPSRATGGDDSVGALLLSGALAAGVGVVGMGLGVGLAIAREDCAARWNGDACWDPASGSRATRCAGDRDAAGLAEAGSIVSFIAGGALLAVGAALIIVASTDSGEASAASLSCAPGLGSITCGGTF